MAIDGELLNVHDHDHSEHAAPPIDIRELADLAAFTPPAEEALRGPLLIPRRALLAIGAVGAFIAFDSRNMPSASAAQTIPTLATPPGSAYANGRFVSRQAMHLHGSGSEGIASWLAHLREAERNGVDVMWPSDHDWRTENYPGQFPLEQVFSASAPKNWTAGKTGSPGSGSAVGLVSASGSNPEGLRINCNGGSAASSETASIGGELTGSIMGRRVELPGIVVKNLAGGASFDVTVALSRQFNLGGATDVPGDGRAMVTYRYTLTPPSKPVAFVNAGSAIVYRQIATGSNNLVIDPLADIPTIWPNMPVPKDNSLTALTLGVSTPAGSTNSGEVVIPRLELPRDYTGQAALDKHEEMLQELAPLTPVQIMRALESSLQGDHTGWYGNGAYTINAASASAVAAIVHANGGFVSKNHPYGVSLNAMLSQSAQDSARTSVATKMLKAGIFFDSLEVGYDSRGGENLSGHSSLADILTQDGGIFTWTGVTDDHNGNRWASGTNCFFTNVLSADRTMASYLEALRAGMATITRLGVYSGEIWCDLEGGQVPMGSVAVNPTARNLTLNVGATQIASGTTVRVIEGTVDWQGKTGAPATRVLKTLTSQDIASGNYPVTVSGVNKYYRLEVVGSNGVVNGFSNPVWNLATDTPPKAGRPIPANRLKYV